MGGTGRLRPKQEDRIRAARGGLQRYQVWWFSRDASSDRGRKRPAPRAEVAQWYAVVQTSDERVGFSTTSVTARRSRSRASCGTGPPHRVARSRQTSPLRDRFAADSHAGGENHTSRLPRSEEGARRVPPARRRPFRRPFGNVLLRGFYSRARSSRSASTRSCARPVSRLLRIRSSRPKVARGQPRGLQPKRRGQRQDAGLRSPHELSMNFEKQSKSNAEK
jgi:hypothetical protein